VTPRTCPRCRATLHTEDANSLVFCWNCGAPQVYLSEELQEQFAQQQLAPQAGDAAATPVEPITDPTAVLWSRAIQLAGLAGAAVLALSLVAAVVPPAALLVPLWAVGAPIVVMGIYCARTPRTRITSAFGSQLGLLTGISIALAYMVVSTLVLLCMRFVLHQGAQLDAQNAESLDTARKWLQTSGYSGGLEQFKSLQAAMAVPEYHAGYAVLGSAMVSAVYTLYATLAGAFAGLLRSRAKAR